MASIRDGWKRFPERRPVSSLAVAIIGCIAIGSSGSVFTAMGLDTWYQTLERPELAPPNWVFGPVWTVLFTLMGIAVWLVWRQVSGPDARRARTALGVFLVHFAINVAWSGAFFGLQSLTAGLVVIIALLVAILATMFAFYRVDWRATALLVPYLAWTSFATYLNYAFWVLN